MTGQNVRRLKRGEILFSEGDKADFAFLLQNGRITLYLLRNQKKIPVGQVKAGSFAGFEGFFGSTKYPMSAEADIPSDVIEVPVAAIRPQIEASSNILKTVTKSICEQLRLAQADIKSLRMEQDNSPCPQMFIPRVFGAINLIARRSGKVGSEGELTVAWTTMRILATRVFLESHVRTENCLKLLMKLGYVNLVYTKNEDDQEVLDTVVIKDIQTIEDFCEFYQYHLFKPGHSEVIYVDKLANTVAKAFLKMTEGQEADRLGTAKLDFNQVVTSLKNDFEVNFNPTLINLLEKKGLFMKRSSSEENSKEVTISFDKKEYQNICKFWNLIDEIDKWNLRGMIVMQEEQAKPAASGAGKESCSQCQAKVQQSQNFCPQCGQKLARAA